MPNLSDSTLVLWNPGAGRADALAQLRQEIDDTPGVERKNLGEVNSLADTMSQAHSSGVRRIVAAGGDGTVNAVLSAAAETPLSIGILPIGTGNDFARSCEIPLDPSQAWRVALQGTPQPVDLLRVDADGSQRMAANMVTAGNTGRYLESMSDDIKQQWGPLAYIRGIATVLTELETFTAKIFVDGQELKHDGLFNLFVANGRTSGGGMPVVPDAEVDDGWFRFLGVHAGTALEVAGLAGSYLAGQYLATDQITHGIGRRLEFSAAEPWPWTIDGETFSASKVTVTVRPHAVQVIFPTAPTTR